MNELLRVLEEMKRKTPKKGQIKGSNFSRVQSPSSINTYFGCPRKYFYNYIEKRATKPSIYLIRGKIVHSVLEDFFNLDPARLTPQGFEMEMRMVMFEDFSRKWQTAKDKINQLGLSRDEQVAFFLDSKKMIANFVNHFAGELILELEDNTFVEAFKKITPKREIYLKDEKHKVQGYVDALYNSDKIRIIDYKTSGSDTMREEYKRQLAIYALMYSEKYGVLPDEVGIHFLLFGVKLMPATMAMVESAVSDIQFVHSRTVSGKEEDYPKGARPLCKWSRGQCDFYDVCGGK